MALVPDPGAKIPHDSGLQKPKRKKKQQKEYCKKSNKNSVNFIILHL